MHPTASPFDRLSRLLDGAIVTGAAAFILLYGLLVCLRVGYSFELEWLEGAAVDHVRTILSGQPLYARPSLAFTPLTYTPGYFYLGAWVSRIAGVGFLPLRAISIAASIGVLIVIFALVARETSSARAGVLASGLFAATYGWTDGWFDLARSDSLMLLTSLLAIYVLRWRRSTVATVAAGVLIVVTFLIKQTGLIIAVPLTLYCAYRGGRALAAFGGTVLVGIVGSSLLLDRLFDGWYLYYVSAVPRQHPLATELLWGFWRFDLFRPFPIALPAAVAYLWWLLRRTDLDKALFFLAAAAALVAGAWASRLHSLSYINVALPAYVALAILFALAAQEARLLVPAIPNVRLARVAAWLTRSAVLCQLVRLIYAPAPLVPTVQDVMAGRQLVQRLSELPGDVLVPYHGYLPLLAGKTPHAHAVVIADVIRGGRTSTEVAFADDLRRALQDHQFASIVTVDSPTPVRAWLPIDQYYRAAEPLVQVRSRFWRPESVYVPK